MPIRWLNVFKREQIGTEMNHAKDHIVTDANKEVSTHSGNIQNDSLDDTITTMGDSVVEPL